MGCGPDDTPDKLDGEPTPLELAYPLTLGTPKFLTEDNPLTVEGVDLGRHLFYDKLLSRDGTISCASCHQQQFAFSDNKAFAKGIDNQLTSRSSMSLANLSYQSDYFWDGRVKTLEEQSLHPIQDAKEMDLELPELINRLNDSKLYTDKFNLAFPGEKISDKLIGKALAQFEATLVSGNSRYDKTQLGQIQATDQEKRGKDLFFTHPEPSLNLRGGNCGDCHSGFLTYSREFSNNGLDENPEDFGLENVTGDVEDRAKFKIPSLRNIALTAPYMHDGRFENLAEVLDHYNEHIKSSPTLDPQIPAASNDLNGTSLGLTDQEKEDIIAFLKTLTDDAFITNPAHSNPFINE